MAAINDLISQIENPELRLRIEQEVVKMSKQKKFGLVFEEHLPENTPLYDLPIRRGIRVAKRDGEIRDNYFVISVQDGIAECEHNDEQHEHFSFPIKDLVAVAQFGEPIYPYLNTMDVVCNAPDSELWHTLIQADNYHALQLLEYLYGGTVDCIYIDPPYNTGARDWKYNNNYVDSNDQYRHSKWLSFMKKRLQLAKKLLNPKDSVLIVTIDEKEYLHLGCLLEDMFPEARIQMISSVINVKGSARKDSFSRGCEYIFFVMQGESSPTPLNLSEEWLGNVKGTTRNDVRLADLLRHGTNGSRESRPNLFYPIYVSLDGKKFVGAGEPLAKYVSKEEAIIPDNVVAIWPIHKNGKEGRWCYQKDSLLDLQKKGYLKLGALRDGKMAFSYIPEGWQKRIENNEVNILGKREDGFLIIDSSEYEATFLPSDSWVISSHNSTENGDKLLQKFIGKRFDFPKSLYAVHDTIRFFVANKPNALIVDFFAGSGTTLHAVNLLNSEDGGHRRCIMVTNNEVSDAEAKSLRKQGYQPGDEEWEKYGIARYVNWPRTVCSIEGHDINGHPLKGSYLGSDIPMSDGFAANAQFFKLGFLDKTSIALGRQFKELLPLLWMKAGAKGKCPSLECEELPSMLVYEKNHFAVLLDEKVFSQFVEKVNSNESIGMVYLVVDSDTMYHEMAKRFPRLITFQLYRDYLDNFRINITR